MADDARRRGFELERRVFELDSKCSGLRMEKHDDDYLQNASTILDKLKNYYRHGAESSSLPKLLQDYTQVVLDVTFYEENQLVDQEFPEDSSPFRIQQLLQDLTEPELLAGRLVPAQDVQTVLGVELLECLYWRRGALLYMYCHTLHQRKQWIKKNKTTFLKYLQEGVRYLMRMLQVRNSVKLSDGVVFHDSTTASFLSEGIFSDTHLLAMMYVGELCFWAVKYEDMDPEAPPERREERIHFRDVGTQVLHKYVLVCEGPLQGQGWSTDNAKEILSVLQ
ncbi:RAB7A-interacting MON1-CCZ1 complex subunit 1 [Paramormyrops kingsleyae]|uniref:RAB7A-interacting MON1-CCZ1 complex subunit 1 n=1 Tax=Paramormyrops kingsleyae TaxID=1676925 RepID=UPI003B97263E